MILITPEIGNRIAWLLIAELRGYRSHSGNCVSNCGACHSKKTYEEIKSLLQISDEEELKMTSPTPKAER